MLVTVPYSEVINADLHNRKIAIRLMSGQVIWLDTSKITRMPGDVIVMDSNYWYGLLHDISERSRESAKVHTKPK